ncbi:MAG: hypothetical protein RLY78_1289 [Pseudomonadota bacterium]
MRLTHDEALDLATAAARAAGAGDATARALAEATVAAEWAGSRAVGFAHLPDYLDGLRSGRIDGHAAPEISFPAPAAVRVDVRRGIAQRGFDEAFDAFVERTRSGGVAVLTLHDSYTVGELGYYTRRLAQQGLVALAACNATAQVTTLESGRPVFGTNPLSFAAPTTGARPFVIDQASSATAFVRLRQAAAEGAAIPEGWAVDARGEPTTSALAALSGLLLPFGGARGAHIAMIVEILGAGLTGGHWSIDAPHYAEGTTSPAVGLFVTAFDPERLVPGFAARLTAQIERLAALGVRIPGSHLDITALDIPEALVAALRAGA